MIRKLSACLFNKQYLTKDQLKAIKSHEYRSIDSNPLNNLVAMPLCDLLLPYIPKTLAPNVLTMGSFVSALSHYVILAYYDYEFYASGYEFDDDPRVPNWVWLYSSISILLCVVLDALDGKHARRLNACSPVGELLDHGVDSWRLSAPMLSCVISLFGRGSYGLSASRMFYLLMALQSAFVLTLWQQYLTKTMYYNWMYDIVQYYLIGFYFNTYLRGGFMWWQCDGYFFGTNAEVLEKSGYILLASVSTWQQIYHLIRHCKKHGLQMTLFDALRPLVAPLILSLATLLWFHCSKNQIIEWDVRAFLWLTGIMFTHLMWRLVLDTMTGSKSKVTNPILNAYCLTVTFVLLISRNVSLIHELTLLRLITVTATLYHLHYVACTIRQISRFYNIRIFAIT